MDFKVNVHVGAEADSIAREIYLGSFSLIVCSVSTTNAHAGDVAQVIERMVRGAVPYTAIPGLIADETWHWQRMHF